ncbi:Plant PDR ABC transporter associated, partial [Dillenia turbinata]
MHQATTYVWTDDKWMNEHVNNYINKAKSTKEVTALSPLELADIRRSIGSSFHQLASSFRSTSDRRSVEDNDDELQLQWAAIERLPTYERIRTSLFHHQNPIDGKEDKQKRVTDVTKLRALERHVFIDKLLKQIEEDNKQLLQKQRERTDRVGLVFPTIEVRYQNLSVEAECEVVQGKPLPTLWNTLNSFLQAVLYINKCKSQANKIKILHDVSGEISYNGYTLNGFIPQKTSSYISQHDVHLSEMTVRETLDFSARCQGNGNKAETMKEVTRREKQAGIVPEPDIDTYMKAISADGLKSSLQTDYILKVFQPDASAFSCTPSINIDIPFGSCSVPKACCGCILRPLCFTSNVSLWRLHNSKIRKVVKTSFITASFPSWLKWGFWISPLSYAEIGASLNEFLAPRWQKVSSSNQTLGQQVLTKHGLYFSGYYFWVSMGALLGFWILLNLGFTIALSYSKAPGTTRATISHEKFTKLQEREDSSNRSQHHLQISTTKGVLETKDLGVILPFEPVTVTFHSIQYFVDTPKLILMKRGGQIIYSGELGHNSNKLIQYFEVVIEIPYIFLQSVLIVMITYPAIDYFCSVYKIFWYSYAIFCTLLYFNYLGLLLVSLSPSFQAASVWVSFSYTLLNLFSGYLIPEPKIPKWWVWLYWICPNAWSLKGLLTSQYGDIKKEINAFGERKAVNEFLRSYFGYNHDQLSLVAVVLFVVPLLFA